MSLPIVAIIGRPNVGKSTIFNRLLKTKQAIVSDIPGTTRDRAIEQVTGNDQSFLLMDTAGVLPKKTTDTLADEIDEQIQMAFEAASVLIFVIDAKDGVTVTDEQIARSLRRQSKPVILVANKVDSPSLEPIVVASRQLGFDEPLLVSASQGRGLAELLDEMVNQLPTQTKSAEHTTDLKVTILGRPNVGKSTLLNAVIGSKRSIVSQQPGTTRDPVNARLQFQDTTIEIIDTAGIRRRGFYRKQTLGKSDRSLEYFSVLRAMKTLREAEIAVLVLDAEQGLTDQDQHIASLIAETKIGAVIAINKWDARLNPNNDQAMDQWIAMLQAKLPFLDYAPVVFLSAAEQTNIKPLLEQIVEISANRPGKLPNRLISNLTAAARDQHPAFPRLLSLKQNPVEPGQFVIMKTSSPVHFSTRRYLENQLRQAVNWPGWPISVVSTPARG